MLRVLKVQGRSLFPLYQDGDFVLVSKIPVFLRRLKPGDLVVFDHEIYGTLIKRIDWLNFEKGELFVLGLDVDSVDSRRFGPIHLQDISGKVVAHIRKPQSI